jgi:hypothetical protein
MLVSADGKAAGLNFGSEWYDLESGKFGLESWRWSPGRATVTVQNPHAFTVVAKMDFSCSSLSPRTLSVVLGGRRVWQGVVTPQTINVTIPVLDLEPGENRLQLTTDDTATTAGKGDTRRLAFRILRICVHFLDSKH